MKLANKLAGAIARALTGMAAGSKSLVPLGVAVAPTTLSMAVGATQQMTATVLPLSAVDKTVVWSSSNPAVATVSASGLVTTIAPGSADIIATSVTGAKVGKCSVTVMAAGADVAEFTMAQLSEPLKIFQRASITGGSQNKGVGTIPVAINVTKVGANGRIFSRIRAADGTVLDSGTLATVNATGAQTVNIAGVPARLGWFYLDLSADGVTYQNGTTLVGMGRRVAFAGQSQAVRCFAMLSPASQTITTLGLTVPDNSSVFATYVDDQKSVATPAWAKAATGTIYDSPFIPVFMEREIAVHGVNVAMIGHAVGATKVEQWAVDTAIYNKFLSTLAAADGGFEAFHWHLGGTDSAAGTTAAVYKTTLTAILNGFAAKNTVMGTSYPEVLTATGNRLAGSGNTAVNVQSIRQAVKEIAAGRAKGFYYEPHDVDLASDKVHQSSTGDMYLARGLHRAFNAQRTGLATAGPVATGATRATNSLDIVVPVTLRTGADALTLLGAPKSRITVLPKGTVPVEAGTGALAIASVAVLASPARLVITLAADPGNTVELDVYFFLYPDPIANGATDMIRDNYVGDGINYGRQLEATTSGPLAVAAPGAGTLPTVNLVAEGDSITYGLNAVSVANDNYPQVSVNQMPNTRMYTLKNIGTSSITAQTINTNFASRAGAAFDATKDLNVFTIMAGTNDGAFTLPIPTYRALRSILRKAKAAGYQRRLIGTILSRNNDVTNPNSHFDGNTLPLNQWIRQYFNSDLDCDGVFDFAADPVFDTTSDADSATYYTDKLHPSTAGYAVMGGIHKNAVVPALSAAGVRTEVPATWSPFDFSAALQLTNSNRTVSWATANNGTCAVKGFIGKSTGKYAWETVIDVANGTGMQVGMCNRNFEVNIAIADKLLHQTPDSIGWTGTTITYNSVAVVSGMPTLANNDVIQHAVDLDANRYWIRKTGGLWNNSASADPVAGVGGIDISGLGTGVRYPAGGIYQSGGQITSRFASSEMASQISGYSPFAVSAVPGVGEVIQLNIFNSVADQVITAPNVAGWNDIDASVNTAASPKALFNSTGVATTAKAGITNATTKGSQNDTTAYPGPVPKLVADTYIYMDKANNLGNGASTLGKVDITGLTAGAKYTVQVYALRVNTAGRAEDITVGGVTKTGNVGTGGTPSTWTVEFLDVVATNGTISVSATQNGTENYAYISAIKLTKTAAA